MYLGEQVIQKKSNETPKATKNARKFNKTKRLEGENAVEGGILNDE